MHCASATYAEQHQFASSDLFNDEDRYEGRKEIFRPIACGKQLWIVVLVKPNLTVENRRIIRNEIYPLINTSAKSFLCQSKKRRRAYQKFAGTFGPRRREQLCGIRDTRSCRTSFGMNLCSSL